MLEVNHEVTSNPIGPHGHLLHTPVDPIPPSWSPILQAETPNLNVPCDDQRKTPALLRSLGICPNSEEANISWQSCMETPNSNAASPCEVYHTPENKENKLKVRLFYQFSYIKI